MKKMSTGALLAAAACSFSMLAAPVAAAPCVKQSPPHTVALVELYTSEG